MAFVATNVVAVRLPIFAMVAVRVPIIPVVKRARVAKSEVDVAASAISAPAY